MRLEKPASLEKQVRLEANNMKKSIQIAVYLVASLMIVTGAIYFVAATEEMSDANGESSHQASGATSAIIKSEENKEQNTQSISHQETQETKTEERGSNNNIAITEKENMFPAQVQTAFFTIAGAAYIPAGLWMSKSKHNSKTPYIIAIVGSVSLIALYVASRMVSLPLVGLQDDVGTIDILSKVMQGGIIAGSIFILTKIKPSVKSNLTV